MQWGTTVACVPCDRERLFYMILLGPCLTSTTFLPGGRQVDGAIPSLYALANIMKSPTIKEAQKSGKLTILFDSGIRTGADIIKAIALGAQAVLCECSVS